MIHLVSPPPPCLQDQSGQDGPLQTLRCTMQEVERAGHVDFELAGHTAERPASVCQGQEDDRPGRMSQNLKKDWIPFGYQHVFNNNILVKERPNQSLNLIGFVQLAPAGSTSLPRMAPCFGGHQLCSWGTSSRRIVAATSPPGRCRIRLHCARQVGWN